MDSRAPRLASKLALSLTIIASKLAPTGSLSDQPGIFRQVPGFELVYLLGPLQRGANGIQPQQQ